MSQSQSQSSVDLSANHDGQVIAICVVFPLFALATVIARIVSKRMRRHRLGADDYLVIAAWVCGQCLVPVASRIDP